MVMAQSIKEQNQERGAILTQFDRIVEAYPNITIAQHMKAIMRTKGKSEDPYSWSNGILLSKMEKYYQELENDPPQFWDDSSI